MLHLAIIKQYIILHFYSMLELFCPLMWYHTSQWWIYWQRKTFTPKADGLTYSSWGLAENRSKRVFVGFNLKRGLFCGQMKTSNSSSSNGTHHLSPLPHSFCTHNNHILIWIFSQVRCSVEICYLSKRATHQVQTKWDISSINRTGAMR